MSGKLKITVLPETTDVGGSPERCGVCDASRWLSSGGGIDLRMLHSGDDADYESAISLCCPCAANVAASIQTQLAFVLGERARTGTLGQ